MLAAALDVLGGVVDGDEMLMEELFGVLAREAELVEWVVGELEAEVATGATVVAVATRLEAEEAEWLADDEEVF